MFDEENDGRHIQNIIQSTNCVRHDANLNIPCWSLPSGSGYGDMPAICNSRAMQAHFTGVITLESVEPKPHGGRDSKSKRSRTVKGKAPKIFDLAPKASKNA